MMTTQDAIRLETLRTAPLNKWVALSSDESRILAVGDNYSEVAAKVTALEDSDVVILKIPPQWGALEAFAY